MNIDELKRNSVINKIRRHNLAVYVTVIVLILEIGRASCRERVSS